MHFEKLDIDPAVNPAILDTATWDPAAAWAAVEALDNACWQSLQAAIATGGPLPTWGEFSVYAPSCGRHEGSVYCLARLPDDQQVFFAIGADSSTSSLGAPIGTKVLPWGDKVAVHPTDAAVIDRFVRFVRPESGPKMLGAVPRLGIGSRMTTAVWPAVWEAMKRRDLTTNAIQNSVRELNLLEDLLAGQPAERNVAFGFGTIEAGYTGSTFEGLWTAGVLDALKHGAPPQFGADADHIQVKRGPNGLARAKRLLEAARYYSFFTLDVSDVLDYDALSAGATDAETYLEARIPEPGERKSVITYHRQPRRIGGFLYRPDVSRLSRLVGKYWVALDALAELYHYIGTLKESTPFDLELSIDEHPMEIATFDCLTSETELIFVLLEAGRRGIPVTHIAPNFGVEKGSDYRCPDGLAGFEARVRSLSRITEEFGVMVDFHSGDDLSATTRRAIGHATGGRAHFKVSPMLQLLYAEVLQDFHPNLFRPWWEDAVAYAQRTAAGGSAFAAECLRKDETSDELVPSAHSEVFHHFSFAFVGRRDADGQFRHRGEFYSLSPAFYRAYRERVVQYLEELADDLFV